MGSANPSSLRLCSWIALPSACCRYKLKSGSLQQFLPTQRAKEETLQVEGVTIKAWDLGGHQAARQLWTKYAAMVRASRPCSWPAA